MVSWRNWHTQLPQKQCPNGLVGSNPTGTTTNDPLVQSVERKAVNLRISVQVRGGSPSECREDYIKNCLMVQVSNPVRFAIANMKMNDRGSNGSSVPYKLRLVTNGSFTNVVKVTD